MRADGGGGPAAGPPFPTPVQFDHAAAEALLTDLKRAMHIVKTRTSSGLKSAARGQDGWTGVAADQFSNLSLPWMIGESARVLLGMEALQRQISQAIHDARALQGRHDAANRHWLDQRRSALS